MDFNSKHIFEPLEGHGGGYLFYYDALFEEFGSGLLTPAIVIISFLFFIFSLKDKAHSIIIFLTVTVTYTFFTFVSTKMYGYVFLCFPFFTLGLAYLFDVFFEKVKTYIKRYIYPLNFFLVLVFLVFLMNPSKLYKHHSDKELGRYKSRLVELRETQLFLTLKEQLGDEKYLIFNCNKSLGAHILAIFYTGYPSFNFVLSKLQIEKARKLNYKIIAIDNGKLPDYVLEDKSIMRIKF